MDPGLAPAPQRAPARGGAPTGSLPCSRRSGRPGARSPLVPAPGDDRRGKRTPALRSGRSQGGLLHAGVRERGSDAVAVLGESEGHAVQPVRRADLHVRPRHDPCRRPIDQGLDRFPAPRKEVQRVPARQVGVRIHLVVQERARQALALVIRIEAREDGRCSEGACEQLVGCLLHHEDEPTLRGRWERHPLLMRNWEVEFDSCSRRVDASDPPRTSVAHTPSQIGTPASCVTTSAYELLRELRGTWFHCTLPLVLQHEDVGHEATSASAATSELSPISSLLLILISGARVAFRRLAGRRRLASSAA